jgi:hypothetical protein
LTDARERGITDTIKTERLTDFSNNTLGRWYAATRAREEALLAQVRPGHCVIRSDLW